MQFQFPLSAIIDLRVFLHRTENGCSLAMVMVQSGRSL